MSELQEIDVTIMPNGEVKVDVRGVKGKKCEAITKPVEELLGGDIIGREYTDEYHEPDQELELGGELKQH